MKCGTVRLDPYLDESSLEDFYTNFYQQMYGRAIDLDSYFLKQKSYGEKVLSVAQSFLKPESWVCEVGCGAGGALKVFQDQGYNVAGCDYSRELIRAGNQKNVKNIYDGSLDTLGSHLSGIKFDLIYLHHVFEHTNDPLSFLENCRKYLAPKGKIIIAVPDISKIDVSKACPGDLLAYLHLAHKYNFSFECLRRMCGITEYSLTRLSPDPNIITHCSILSELWVQLTIKNDKSCEEINNNLLLNEPGTRLIRYLKLTEKLYSLGLTKGQLLHKLSSSLGYVKTFLQKSKNYVFSFF
jgi:SAM-dependent methyltransferase